MPSAPASCSFKSTGATGDITAGLAALLLLMRSVCAVHGLGECRERRKSQQVGGLGTA